MGYRLNGRRIYKVKGNKPSKTGRKTYPTRKKAKNALRKRGKRH